MPTKTHIKIPKLDTSHPAVKSLDTQVKQNQDLQRMIADDDDCAKYFAVLSEGGSMAAGADNDD